MYTVNDAPANKAFMNHAELHGSVSILLPAFTNGTLDSDEQQILAKHLAHCSECYRELCSISGIRETMCANDLTVDPDTEASFGKLMEMVEAQKRSKPSIMQLITETLSEQWSAAVFSFRGAVVLQVLFISLLSFAWLDAGKKINADYYTLSDPESSTDTEIGAVGGSVGIESVVSAGIIFDGNTPMVAIQDALAEVDAKIVSGPNTMGMYRINAASSVEKTRDWIKRLRESRKAVFAEITDTRHL